MSRTRALWALSMALLAAFAGVPAGATSYAPVSDETLVAQAPVAAVLRVEAVAPAAGEAATDYRMTVERALKGPLRSTALTVRVPGGVDPGGRVLRIWGAPRFTPGERVLLFLAPRADGRYDLVHLMLGAFFEVRAGGRRLALRDLSEARRVELPGRPSTAEPQRDFAGFADWIARRARGREPAGDYLVSAAGGANLRAAAEPYAFLNGQHFRWFEFDASTAVSWRAHEEGQEGVAGGGFTEFQTALAAWNADADTNVDYTYAGTTTSEAGFDDFDGLNTILFNRDVGYGSFSCTFGGVIAIGGPWYDSGFVRGYKGTSFFPIFGADIITNEGLACFFAASPDGAQAAAEVFAHELGHTLGLGHSDLADALMFAFIHDDGRGASLHPDDRAGIKALYGPNRYSFYTLPPCRLLDTRNPTGPTGGGPLQSGETWTFQAGGGCGIPNSARALSANVTAVGPSSAGYLTLFPTGSPPATSAINFAAGQTRANNLVLVLSLDSPGLFRITPSLSGAGSVHVLVDVNGWFE